MMDRLRAAAAEQLGGLGWRPGRATPLRDGYLRAEFGVDDEAAIKAAVRRVRGQHHDLVRAAGDALAAGALPRPVRDRWRTRRVRHVAGRLGRHDGARAPRDRTHAEAHDPPVRQLRGAARAHREGRREGRRYARGRVTGALDTIDACTAPLEDNRALLEGEIGYPTELLTYHPGWFQATVPAAAPSLGPIALLRLDGDWYESTAVCLRHLYPLVPPGGVVVIDDYGHWEGARRAVDEFVASLDEPILLSHIDYTGRYWVRQASAATT
jgi:hypothetical protein